MSVLHHYCLLHALRVVRAALSLPPLEDDVALHASLASMRDEVLDTRGIRMRDITSERRNECVSRALGAMAAQHEAEMRALSALRVVASEIGRDVSRLQGDEASIRQVVAGWRDLNRREEREQRDRAERGRLAAIAESLGLVGSEVFFDPQRPESVEAITARGRELVADEAALIQLRGWVQQLARELGASEQYTLDRPMEALRDRTLTMVGQHAQTIAVRDRLLTLAQDLDCDVPLGVTEADPIAAISDVIADIARRLAARAAETRDEIAGLREETVRLRTQVAAEDEAVPSYHVLAAVSDFVGLTPSTLPRSTAEVREVLDAAALAKRADGELMPD